MFSVRDSSKNIIIFFEKKKNMCDLRFYLTLQVSNTQRHDHQ